MSNILVIVVCVRITFLKARYINLLMSTLHDISSYIDFGLDLVNGAIECQREYVLRFA